MMTLAQKAVLKHLKNSPGVVALVPKNQQHRQSTPAEIAWPFLRFGPPNELPFKGACFDGGLVGFAIHAFTKPVYVGGVEIKTAEDVAGEIADAIKAAVDGVKLIQDGKTVKVTWESRSIVMDPAETDAYHAIINMRCRVY